MKWVSTLAIILSMPLFAFAAGDSCEKSVNERLVEHGAPYAPFGDNDYAEIIEAVEINSQLSQQETDNVIQMLKRGDVEAYSGYAQLDTAGFNLLIVDKNCSTLWNGFFFYK